MPEESGQNPRREHSFDDLARGLASGTVSRRHALKLVGGALLGGVLGAVPGVSAWAQNRPPLPPQNRPPLPPQAAPQAQSAVEGCHPPCSAGELCCQAPTGDNICCPPSEDVCVVEGCGHTCELPSCAGPGYAFFCPQGKVCCCQGCYPDTLQPFCACCDPGQTCAPDATTGQLICI